MSRLLLVLLILSAARLDAIAPVSSLGGRVTTTDGAPLAGATVTLTSALLQQPRETRTAANGAYWIPALPPGLYEVTFSLTKHQTITRRAELHTGEQARVDVELAPSEEEEAISSTASEHIVLEEPRSVFSVDGETLNVLPIDRVATVFRVDEQRTRRALDVPLDAVRELAIPISAPHFDEPWAVTRDATNTPAASVRATFGEGGNDVFEATAGGSAIDDRLWLYGYALARDGATTAHARVTASPSSRDVISVFAHDTLSASWLRAGERLTAFASASRHGAFAQAFYFAGAHELSAGVERTGAENRFFVRDRFTFEDLTVEGVLRVDDQGELAPRIGAAYRLGSHRVAAWFDDARDEAGAAFAQHLRGGYVRATLLHRPGTDEPTEIVADGAARWLLFNFGALARYADGEVSGAAWTIVEPPLLEHRLSIAALTRYEDAFSLDAAVTYAYAGTRIVPFVKLETVDLTRPGRVWRIGFGASL